eukprot:scaffold103152_cov30-Tisochrysis_lutea.AAC.4
MASVREQPAAKLAIFVPVSSRTIRGFASGSLSGTTKRSPSSPVTWSWETVPELSKLVVRLLTTGLHSANLVLHRGQIPTLRSKRSSSSAHLEQACPTLSLVALLARASARGSVRLLATGVNCENLVLQRGHSPTCKSKRSSSSEHFGQAWPTRSLVALLARSGCVVKLPC